MDQPHATLLLAGIVVSLLVIALDRGWILRFLDAETRLVHRVRAKITKGVGHA